MALVVAMSIVAVEWLIFTFVLLDCVSRKINPQFGYAEIFASKSMQFVNIQPYKWSLVMHKAYSEPNKTVINIYTTESANNQQICRTGLEPVYQVTEGSDQGSIQNSNYNCVPSRETFEALIMHSSKPLIVPFKHTHESVFSAINELGGRGYLQQPL